jgi:hypothetical protein
MKKYASLTEDNKVDNVVVAGSLDIAETVTSSICILVTEETGNPHIGLGYSNGIFEQPAVEEAPAEETPA